ncbi:uncharacterized protein LOC143562214 [Bidens hawaiensis]|uniref:uncharacterized protein LOC143562214 n=1 Tax=Bidens hawaiensis TaxID=980011 RepID=UPI00404B7736
MLHLQQDQIFTTQLDDIPIVQPTTPTGTPSTFPPTTTTPIGGDPTTLPPPSGFQPNNPTPMTPFPTGPSGPTGQTGPNPTGPSGPSSGGSWCVASSSASETSLQVALDYGCGYGGADCSAIQPGASCYNPNTVRDHASYAFNAYYQKNPAPTSCSFGGVAQLTNTDPSSGGCQYPAGKSSGGGMTPPSPPTPSAPTTPTMSTPINPYPTSPSAPFGGGGSTDQPGYTSLSPSGEPSSAGAVACNLLLPLVLVGLLMIMNREK